jgi:SAM-dependent methyltransferase
VSAAPQTAATIQGELWSTRAGDWAELQESQHRLKYEDAIQRIGIGPGRTVLDLGCGAGTFCRMAADAGATVTGIDAAPALVEIARERVPEGQFDVGDIQSLPYEDGSFDRVTAFNSVQFVPGPAAALAEIRRVSRPGARVYILVWGRQEHTELVAIMKALHPLAPPRPPGGPGAFALSPPGLLEDLITGSGLTPLEAGYIELPYEYPDQATMLRAQCSSAPAVLAARTSGEAKVSEAIISALLPYRTESGGYRIQTEYRYLTATSQPAGSVDADPDR